MYRIKEFAAMTGLPQSKIRFYEKHGLLLSNREENGYRVFTPEDAFRSNAFRMLMQYGFSINEAIEMLDAKQGTEDFEKSLSDQREKLIQELDTIQYRLSRIDNALDAINSELDSGFVVMDMLDQLYINASIGRDFSVSVENERVVAEFYDLLSITSCARIIRKAEFDTESPTIDPDYVIAVSENEKFRLSAEAREQASILYLGKCIRFRRRATREESVKKETFDELFAFLDRHGYELRDDIILFPSFLNLDGQGSDIETLYIPIR